MSGWGNFAPFNKIAHSQRDDSGKIGWEMIGPEGGTYAGVVTDPLYPDTATIVSDNIRRTTDGGSSWSIVGQGGTIWFFPDYMDFEFFDSDRLYTPGYDSITRKLTACRSSDGGSTWSAGTLPPHSGEVYCVYPHPSDPNIVYGGGLKNLGTRIIPYFFKSTDGGLNYTGTDLSGSLGEWAPFDMAVSANDPNIIYLSGYGLSPGYIPKMAKSIDGGANWTLVDINPPSDERGFVSIAIDPVDDDYVYAGGIYFYMSSDGGTTWSQGSIYTYFIHDICIDPTNTTNIYIGTYSNIFVSKDRGSTWIEATVPWGYPLHLDINPTSPATVYCACSKSAVCKSVDGGITWEIANNGILEAEVLCIEVSESSPERIYASISGCPSLKVTQNGGETWEENDNLPGDSLITYMMEHSQNPEILLAVLPGG